jgi:hypothetical protein
VSLSHYCNTSWRAFGTIVKSRPGDALDADSVQPAVAYDFQSHIGDVEPSGLRIWRSGGSGWVVSYETVIQKGELNEPEGS